MAKVITVKEYVDSMPRAARAAVVIIGSALVAYFAINIILAFLGSGLGPLISPLGIAVVAGAYCICGVIGYFLKRAWIPFAVLAVLNVCFVGFFLLHSVGSPWPGVRNLFAAVAEAALNAWLLMRWRD